MGRQSRSPSLWLQRFCHDKNLHRGDRNYHELKALTDALEAAGEYDQLNLGALISVEILCRRIATIAKALERGAASPDWSMAPHIMWGSLILMIFLEGARKRRTGAREKSWSWNTCAAASPCRRREVLPARRIWAALKTLSTTGAYQDNRRLDMGRKAQASAHVVQRAAEARHEKRRGGGGPTSDCVRLANRGPSMRRQGLFPIHQPQVSEDIWNAVAASERRQFRKSLDEAYWTP